MLCTFHVIKYLHSKIANLPLSIEEKIQLNDIIHEMIYCSSNDDYDKFFQNLLAFSDRVGDFVDYFERNWNNCTEMWAQYHRNTQKSKKPKISKQCGHFFGRRKTG